MGRVWKLIDEERKLKAGVKGASPSVTRRLVGLGGKSDRIDIKAKRL